MPRYRIYDDSRHRPCGHVTVAADGRITLEAAHAREDGEFDLDRMRRVLQTTGLPPADGLWRAFLMSEEDPDGPGGGGPVQVFDGELGRTRGQPPEPLPGRGPSRFAAGEPGPPQAGKDGGPSPGG
jgi:hypothetical protein